MDASSSTTSTSTPASSDFSPPSSILIIGSGVFGLSTAYALTSRDVFSNTSITVVDRASAPSTDDSNSTPVFPARDASSIDTSRIIRGDYADPAYAALATDALRQWRKVDSPDALGAQGRYSESGLVLVADCEPEALGKLTSPSSPAADVGASLLEEHNAKKTGVDYVRASWENAVALGARDPELAARIRLLPDADAIREAVGTGGYSGSKGYINGYAGWADAEKSMAWLYERVRKTGRVNFVSGTVTSLEHTDDSVTGAKLTDGRTLSADLVILATGAWTASLLDLSGQATATGQVVAYMDITPEEQSQLSKMPVLLNLTTGLFIIPPSNNVLKVARHAYGYLNPTALTTTTPLSPTSPSAQKTVSYPRTNLTVPQALTIPAEGIASLRSALRQMLPSHQQLHDRPFSKTRLCWYTDTPTGDFIISYHPRFRGLFVATGGSGHGFKFLPVLGDKILDAVEGRTPVEFAEKWAWKEGCGEELVATEDGSRGGVPGLVLDEELGEATDSS
ncbi:FAD dependent oxidoreductase [Coniochaeta sp. PMI_546]|nr:FAD dependent oxidoreductase [Coniochaeta sp. PMI_546]